MQYAQNLDGVVLYSIRQDKGCSPNYQFACARHTACSAGVWMFSQKLSGLPNTSNHFSRGFRIIFGNKIRCLFEVE